MSFTSYNFSSSFWQLKCLAKKKSFVLENEAFDDPFSDGGGSEIVCLPGYAALANTNENQIKRCTLGGAESLIRGPLVAAG